MYDLKDKSATSVGFENPKAPPLTNSLLFRLRTSMDLKFQLDNNPGEVYFCFTDKLTRNTATVLFSLRACQKLFYMLQVLKQNMVNEIVCKILVTFVTMMSRV